MTEVEVHRHVTNRLLGQHSAPVKDVIEAYFDRINLLLITDAVLDDAITIQHPLGGADAIHVASALQLGPSVTFVTHDRQQASAMLALGFKVLDPVIDDPRGPVTAPPA